MIICTLSNVRALLLLMKLWDAFDEIMFYTDVYNYKFSVKEQTSNTTLNSYLSNQTHNLISITQEIN